MSVWTCMFYLGLWGFPSGTPASESNNPKKPKFSDCLHGISPQPISAGTGSSTPITLHRRICGGSWMDQPQLFLFKLFTATVTHHFKWFQFEVFDIYRCISYKLDSEPVEARFCIFCESNKCQPNHQLASYVSANQGLSKLDISHIQNLCYEKLCWKSG